RDRFVDARSSPRILAGLTPRRRLSVPAIVIEVHACVPLIVTQYTLEAGSRGGSAGKHAIVSIAAVDLPVNAPEDATGLRRVSANSNDRGIQVRIAVTISVNKLIATRAVRAFGVCLARAAIGQTTAVDGFVAGAARATVARATRVAPPSLTSVADAARLTVFTMRLVR